MFANPVLVGAVTVLVVIVAVFLSYNANQGLPFVPTFKLKADVPSGAQLVPGNEVREGGYRIGIVSDIQPKKLSDGSTGAELTLKLDKDASPVPADSTVRVRPRSALGLKYVEFHRGSMADTLADGATIRVGDQALAPELQEFFNIFDERTRDHVRENLTGYGNALAFRGASLNRALESLPRFLGTLPPVMDTLAAPDTGLGRFFAELGDAARVAAPIAQTIADGFRDGGTTFAALAHDPKALQDTIAETPATLAVGTSALRNSRPLFASLARVAPDLRGAAAELRAAAPPLNVALRSGIRPLEQVPALASRLTGSFDALTSLARAPGSTMGLAALDETVGTLNPTLRFIGPYQTVCNYWNYMWTFLSDHITDEEQTGQIQRIQAKLIPPTGTGGHGLDSFGQAYPTDTLHAQAYGAAITPSGDADCENGQRGFPRHLASGMPVNMNIAIDPETPGAQGPTYRGRPSVPKGQTFSAIPEGAPELRK